MHASSILAFLGAASLATALPQGTPQEPTEFDVTGFQFGFTTSVGYYSGQFSVPGYASAVTCKGASNVSQWQPCDAPGNGISTYLSLDESTQEYTLNAIYTAGSGTFYRGQTCVYSETGNQADKARKDFEIPITGKAQTA